jgi:anti-sigma B factor antagonist
MAEFTLEDRTVGDWAVLAVTGEVDLATAPAFRERLVHLIADGRHHIVVDLSGTDFLDSTGLGALVTALKRIRAHDGQLRLVVNQDRIRKVFEITSLDRVLDIHDALESAITG